MVNVQVFCPKGHLYDPSVHPSCPYCSSAGGISPITPVNQGGGVPPTIPLNPPQVVMNPTIMVCPNGHQYDSSLYSSCPSCNSNKKCAKQNKTYVKDGLINQPVQTNSQPRVRPVVGWLVCIEGPDIGKDFRLHAQFNYVGRNEDQDISLNDGFVSGEKHLTVSYDMLNHRYFAEKDGSSFVYINGHPLV